MRARARGAVVRRAFGKADPSRREARPSTGAGSEGTAASGEWRDAAVALASVSMACTVYAWAIGRPVPVSLAQADSGLDPLMGIPAALAIGIVVALAIVVPMTVLEATRVWRGRVAAAAVGLYLAATFSAIGSAALVLAPAAFLGILVANARRRIALGGLLVGIHAGCLGTAFCFFNQWPQYAAGWEPFLRNLRAVVSLLF